MIEREEDKPPAISKKQRGRWNWVVRQKLEETKTDVIIKVFPDEEQEAADEFARQHRETLRNDGIIADVNVDYERVTPPRFKKKKPWFSN